jgi:hypothetical protein
MVVMGLRQAGAFLQAADRLEIAAKRLDQVGIVPPARLT